MLVRLIGDFKLVVRMRMREVVGVSLYLCGSCANLDKCFGLFKAI